MQHRQSGVGTELQQTWLWGEWGREPSPLCSHSGSRAFSAAFPLAWGGCEGPSHPGGSALVLSFITPLPLPHGRQPILPPLPPWFYGCSEASAPAPRLSSGHISDTDTHTEAAHTECHARSQTAAHTLQLQREQAAGCLGAQTLGAGWLAGSPRLASQNLTAFSSHLCHPQ